MNSAPVTLPFTSSTTATGESAAAGEASASRPRQTAIERFMFRTPSESAGSLVAPAPEWFHGWIKNTRPVRQRNRPIAPDGRRGQPPDAPTAFSRDAVGIVIFGKSFSLLCTTASLSHCCGRIREGGWIAGRAGSKRHGFSFHGDAPHAPCRHASDRVLGERCARRGGEFAGVAAATCGHAVTVAIGPEGRSRAGHRRDSPPAAEQHRLPPDSTTRQTLALPGRTLDFTATAGSIRLFDDKGEPQADIAYTSYQLDERRSRKPAGDVSVQRRPGRVLGLAAVRRRRPLARVDHQVRARCRPRRLISCPTPRPGSTSPISSSSIPSAPATAVSSRPARMRASGSTPSTATSAPSRS